MMNLSNFHYCPDTGKFTNKKGHILGTKTKTGYIQLCFNRKSYLAHRVAWFYMTGTWPSFIDHVDGNKSNNCWSNLREVNPQLNQQNQRRAHTRSTTGLLGVSNHRCGYQALIRVDNKSVYLGKFNTPEEAHACYIQAKRLFHKGNTL